MSEAGKKTLLLEQGGPSYYITGGRERPGWINGTDLSRVDVPGFYKAIYSEPTYKLLCNDTQLNAYGGCTIGGNQAINAGLFFQPPASDFDLYFPKKWKSKDVAGAIKKLRAKQPYTNNPSKNGKFYVQSGYEAAKKWLVDGAGYKDVAFNQVPNEKTKTFGRPEFNYEGGQRSGAVETYLQSALSRSNFKLQSGTQVQRVLRDGSTATGLLTKANDTQSTIKLRPGGRVVLSGGALFSPQLLMLSGIGEASMLKNLSSHGLLDMAPSSWINNSAVGDGLFDNPNTFIELQGPTIESYVYNYSYPIPADAQLYLNERSGPYAFASETSAFWDVIHNADGSVTGVQGTIDSAGYGDFMQNNTITLNVYGTSGMKSTGRVGLNMTTGAPGQEAPFFYTDASGSDASAIATFIYDLFQALPKSGSGLVPQNLAQNSTKAEILKYISNPTDQSYTVGNVNHWSSSCRIDKCVDLDTKVKGMQNLFVADASIVAPLTTNPSFGVMIAAERASELILALKDKWWH